MEEGEEDLFVGCSAATDWMGAMIGLNSLKQGQKHRTHYTGHNNVYT